MALTDEGSGLGAVMPVAPMYGNNGGYGGYPMAYPVMPMYGGYGNNGGMLGGDFSSLIVLFLFCALFGGFGGGWGGNGFGGYEGGAFPWLLASNNNTDNIVSAGFAQQATNTAVQGVQSAVTSGFGDTALGIAGLGRQICETGGDIRQTVSNGFAQAEIAEQGRHNSLTQQLYNNEINNLNRSFAEQTANTQAINGVSKQLADCCCENRLATQGLQAVIQSENCADRAAISDGIRDILTATQAQNQRILDKLCDQELMSERRENDALRTQLNMAQLAASQNAQTAQLVADNNAQTQYIVNRVAPYPIPAYPVGNPYGYNGYNGWNNGWGNGYGFNPFGNVGFGNGSF